MEESLAARMTSNTWVSKSNAFSFFCWISTHGGVGCRDSDLGPCPFAETGGPSNMEVWSDDIIRFSSGCYTLLVQSKVIRMTWAQFLLILPKTWNRWCIGGKESFIFIPARMNLSTSALEETPTWEIVDRAHCWEWWTYQARECPIDQRDPALPHDGIINHSARNIHLLWHSGTLPGGWRPAICSAGPGIVSPVPGLHSALIAVPQGTCCLEGPAPACLWWKAGRPF